MSHLDSHERHVERKVENWLNTHGSVRVIDPRRLQKELAVDSLDLGLIFARFAKTGRVRLRFGVIAPSNHVLAPESFDNPEDIPETLYDSAEDLFSTSDAEIVPLYSLGPSR